MFRKSTFQAQPVAPLDERLADALEHIASTEGQWFDGTVESIHTRQNRVDRARHAARQFILSGDTDERAMSAMEIEHNLGLMSDNLRQAAEHFVSDEIVDAQRELPHYSINVLDY